MHKHLRQFIAVSAVFAALLTVLLVVATGRAQPPAVDSTAALSTAALDTAGAVAQPFIVGFAQRFPWLVTALAVIATLRLVFKPLMSAAHVFVQSTPSTGDDEALARVEHSRAFKIAAWLLDYLGSIKVGPQKTDTAKPAPQPAPPAA